MPIAIPFLSGRAKITRADQACPHLQRNFTLGVVSGVAYNLYASTLSTQLVMTWFVSELTDSNFLVSLLLPIEIGSWYVLQLLLSGHVQRRARGLPLYRAMGGIRVASLAALSAATFILDRPGSLLLVFMIAFTANSLAAGAAALPFLNVVAKTIPLKRRGMYFGWRRFAGGLLGIAGAALVRTILAPGFTFGFPDSYALLFTAGCLIPLVMVGSFSLVAEPRQAVGRRALIRSGSESSALREALRDSNYRRYLGLRVALAVGSYALPFYAVYARRVLNASSDRLGTYLLGSTLTGVLSNLLLGGLGDRYGNRLLVRLAALTAALPPAAALALSHLTGTSLDQGALFTIIFALQGLHATAHSIGSNNYLLEIGSPAQRVTTIALAHGVIGFALLGSPLSSVIVNQMGFAPLFAISMFSTLTAIVLSLGLDEPRRSQGPALEG